MSNFPTRVVLSESQVRILSMICITISFAGFLFFEQFDLFFAISLGGFLLLAFGLLTEQKAKLMVIFTLTLGFSIAASFGAILLVGISLRIAFALLTEAVVSWILPWFLLGSLVFHMLRPRLEKICTVLDAKELEREDDVLLKSVSFFQATFFILQGMQLLEADFWFISAFLAANVLFFVFRGYAIIRRNNRCRYRSVVLLTSLPGFDLLVALRNRIMDLPVFVPTSIFVPIPVSWTVLILVLIVFGLVFSFLRVMLLNRYKLAEDVVF